MDDSTQPPKGRPKRFRRLTKRQDKAIKYLAEHPTASLQDAGMVAGYKESNAGASVASALRSPNVQEVLADMMEKDPTLCNSALLVKLREGLESNKKTYFADRNGNITEEKTDDDQPTRKEYLKLAFQVKGALINKQEISGGEKPVSTVDLSFLQAEQLLKLIDATDEAKK